MKRALIVFALMAMVVGFSSTGAYADNSASASASFMSNYVWRGYKLSDSWVLQPTVDFAKGNLGVNFWSNYDGDTGEVNETDITISYSIPVEGMDLSVGLIYYDMSSDSQEFYVTAGKEMGSVSPYLSIYRDTDAFPGWTVVLGADYSLEPVTIGASLSYANSDDDYSALHNFEVKASTSFDMGDGISISPMAAFTTAASSDAKDLLESSAVDGDTSVFYAGVTVSTGF